MTAPEWVLVGSLLAVAVALLVWVRKLGGRSALAAALGALAVALVVAALAVAVNGDAAALSLR